MNVRANRRPLKAIEASLAKSLKAHGASEVECGEWLNEARNQLDHGEWLLWLDAHFPHSVDTAGRWMGVAKLFDRFRNLRNLKLTKGASYYLANRIDDIDDRIVAAIAKVAAGNPNKWIGDDAIEVFTSEIEAREREQEAQERGITVAELEQERKQQEEQEEQELQERQRALEEWRRKQAESAAEAAAEADAMLDASSGDDGPPRPVEAPVGERPSQDKFIHDTLMDAVERLDAIVSKPLQVLAAASVSSDAMERVGRFLLDIVNARNPRRDAA
jgi:hypothetical protein